MPATTKTPEVRADTNATKTTAPRKEAQGNRAIESDRTTDDDLHSRRRADAPRKKAAPVGKPRPTKTSPGAIRTEFERLGLVVVEETGMPLGRPWRAITVDVDTREVIGFEVSFEKGVRASAANTDPTESFQHGAEPRGSRPIDGVSRRIEVETSLAFHDAEYALGIVRADAKSRSRRAFREVLERYFRGSPSRRNS